MGKIVDVLAPFAHLQVAAGARAIQVFDSWVGALGSDDYVRFAAPYSRALIERIRSTGVPVIHFGTGASGFFKRTACRRRRRDGRRLAHQHRPGLDGHQLPLGHPGQSRPGGAIRAASGAATKVQELLKRTGTRPGHIFNLGHGILPETPVENVRAVSGNGPRIQTVGICNPCRRARHHWRLAFPGFPRPTISPRRGSLPHCLESRPRAGRRHPDRQVEGCTLEAGPDSFLSVKPAALELISELGLPIR